MRSPDELRARGGAPPRRASLSRPTSGRSRRRSATRFSAAASGSGRALPRDGRGARRAPRTSSSRPRARWSSSTPSASYPTTCRRSTTTPPPRPAERPRPVRRGRGDPGGGPLLAEAFRLALAYPTPDVGRVLAGGDARDDRRPVPRRHDRRRARRRRPARLHSLKTGRLLQASIRPPSPWRASTRPSRRPGRQLGAEIGLLFQIVDDVLDATGTERGARQDAGEGRGGRQGHLRLAPRARAGARPRGRDAPPRGRAPGRAPGGHVRPRGARRPGATGGARPSVPCSRPRGSRCSRWRSIDRTRFTIQTDRGEK